jgi:hypothetical protein
MHHMRNEAREYAPEGPRSSILGRMRAFCEVRGGVL